MPLEFLESVQWFRRSEGGLEIAPPPSGARYKNTPVGRGLMCMEVKYKTNMRVNLKRQLTFAFEELIVRKRLNAVYPRLYFWLGSALVALIDVPPLLSHCVMCGVDVSLYMYTVSLYNVWGGCLIVYCLIV